MSSLGVGSVLNADGEVEMDAVIMDGKHMKSGAVGCVQNIKNPITLARAVMEKVRGFICIDNLNVKTIPIHNHKITVAKEMVFVHHCINGIR